MTEQLFCDVIKCRKCEKIIRDCWCSPIPCPFCDDAFGFVQDWNIHLQQEHKVKAVVSEQVWIAVKGDFDNGMIEVFKTNELAQQFCDKENESSMEKWSVEQIPKTLFRSKDEVEKSYIDEEFDYRIKQDYNQKHDIIMNRGSQSNSNVKKE